MDNIKLIIGYGEPIMQIYKSRIDIEIEIERKHICEVMMSIIQDTQQKSDEIEKGEAKQSKEYRQKMKEWRAIPICDRCGDLTNLIHIKV